MTTTDPPIVDWRLVEEEEYAAPPPPFALAPLERWAPAIFLAITFAVFGRALFNEYAYDSTILIPRLAQQNATLLDLMNPDRYGTVSAVMSWRPLPVASFLLLDNMLFRGNAALSHALNLLIHALNGWLLFGLMRRWQWGVEEARALWPALIGATLFLVHPLVSEAVLCAGFRFDLMATTFVLLALRVAMARPDSAAAGLPSALLAAGALTLGLLSKESAVLVLAMAPLALFVLRRDGRGAVLQALVLAAAAGLFAFVWLKFRYVNYNTKFLGGGDRWLGMANFLASAKDIYLRLLVVPWPLRVNHGFVPATELADPRLLHAALVVGGLGLFAAVAAWLEPFCLLGAAWVGCAFLPVSQIVPVPDAVAERFCYLPMAGVGIFAAGALARIGKYSEKPLPFFAIVLLPLAFLSGRRTWQWQDDLTLNAANWEAAPAEDPETELNLAGVLLLAADRARQDGDHDREKADSERAGALLTALLASDPGHAEGQRLMAVWHLREGRRTEAMAHFHASRRAWPDNPALVPLQRFLGS